MPTTEQDSYAAISKIMREHGVTIDTIFLTKRPQSAWKAHDYKRHWLYTLYQDVGPSSWVEIATGNYTEGSGYCEQPEGLKSGTQEYFDNVKNECCHGITYTGGLVAHPKPEDVLWSLCQDASCVMNCETFSDFCHEFGYDIDSRDAERVYKECQTTYTNLRATIGQAGIEAVLACQL